MRPRYLGAAAVAAAVRAAPAGQPRDIGLEVPPGAILDGMPGEMAQAPLAVVPQARR